MNSTIIIYLTLNFLIFFLCSKISYKLKLVDIPKTRKVHLRDTAYTGGIIVSIILLIGIQLFNLSDVTLK